MAAKAIDKVKSSGPHRKEHRHPFGTLARRYRSTTAPSATPKAERNPDMLRGPSQPGPALLD
jgi:hypothetical protein